MTRLYLPKRGAVRQARKDSEQEERGEKEQEKAKDAGWLITIDYKKL